MGGEDGTGGAGAGSPWQAATALLRELPASVKGLIGLAVAAGLTGAVIAGWGSAGQDTALLVLAWVAAVALALAILLTIVHAVADARRRRHGEVTAAAVGALARVAAIRTSSTVIGVHLGRSQIECGVVHVAGVVSAGVQTLAEALRSAEVTELLPASARPNPGDETVLRAVAAVVAATARTLRREHAAALPVGAVCIALPGLLDLPRKLVVMTSRGIPQNTQVADRVAEGVLAELGDEAVDVFGTESARRPADLARRIFLSNDATAVARAHVADQPEVADVVCLVVDDGVGGGIVAAGDVVYGHRYAAGEFGHQVLPLPSLPGSGDRGVEHDAMRFLRGRARERCACGGRGLHWEMTCNAGALAAALAETGAGGPGREVPTLSELLAAARARSSPAPGAPAPSREDDDALSRAAQLVAMPLGIGIASLANVLNPEQVILTGRVAEVLETSLQQVLQQRVDAYTLKPAAVSVIVRPRLWEAVWRGAALLVLDPSYSRLFPEHAQREVPSPLTLMLDEGAAAPPGAGDRDAPSRAGRGGRSRRARVGQPT